ncbi:MAG TPA: hypothetical protein VGB06_01995 [Solirubrobacterales bacterium]|jgi:hypothetical protein
MRDGDYRDIRLAAVFAAAVVVGGSFFLGESQLAAGLVLLVAFTGATLIMEYVADRERRKHGERT